MSTETLVAFGAGTTSFVTLVLGLASWKYKADQKYVDRVEGQVRKLELRLKDAEVEVNECRREREKLREEISMLNRVLITSGIKEVDI